SGDPSATVSQAALERGEPLATQALDMFCELYGAEAGNMVLRALTIGGVFLGGGIGPKILPALRKSFARGYLDKGRFAQLFADGHRRSRARHVVENGLRALLQRLREEAGELVDLGLQRGGRGVREAVPHLADHLVVVDVAQELQDHALRLVRLDRGLRVGRRL